MATPKSISDSNDQTYLDSGELRNVRICEFDAEGNLSDEIIVLGQAETYAEARAMAEAAGYRIAPSGEGYDIGHIANPDGLDAYGIPVIVEA